MSTLNPPQFRSMNELTDFINSLDKRIADLERENGALKDELSKVKSDRVLPAVKASEVQLPHTKILSDNYITRAFAVWGHYFVANLIISIPLIICWLILYALVFSQYASNFIPYLK